MFNCDAREWTVHDVGVWLEALGLGQYVSAFAASSVDGDLLLDVNENLLRKTLQMRNKLHRRSFFAAVRLHVDRAAADQIVEGGASVGQWPLDRVLAWLHSIELSGLVEPFQKAAVHGAFLLTLIDDEDVSTLEAIGVANLVQRLKLRTSVRRVVLEASLVDETTLSGGHHHHHHHQHHRHQQHGASSNKRASMSVAEVGVWLSKYGFAPYREVFEEVCFFIFCFCFVDFFDFF